MSAAEHEQKGAWGGEVSPRPRQWSEGTLADPPEDHLGMQRRLSRGSMPQDPESNLGLDKIVENGSGNRGVPPRIPNPGIVVAVVVPQCGPMGLPSTPSSTSSRGNGEGCLPAAIGVQG